MLRFLLSSAATSTRHPEARLAAQFASSTGRWSAAKASSSRSRAAAGKGSKAAAPTASTASSSSIDPPSASSRKGALNPEEQGSSNSKPQRDPAESRAFFVQLGMKRRAEKERFRQANRILVPVETGEEVQYETAEEFQAAQEVEQGLKKERIAKAAQLFDEGKLPEEIRSLVGGRKKPFALSTVRRYLLDRASEDTPEGAEFKELLELNWGRFTFDGGEYADAPDLKEALRRLRVERGEETEYRPPRTKPKVDKWQRK